MSDPKLRNFHEAKWDEPVIFEQSVPGSRRIYGVTMVGYFSLMYL